MWPGPQRKQLLPQAIQAVSHQRIILRDTKVRRSMPYPWQTWRLPLLPEGSPAQIHSADPPRLKAGRGKERRTAGNGGRGPGIFKQVHQWQMALRESTSHPRKRCVHEVTFSCQPVLGSQNCYGGPRSLSGKDKARGRESGQTRPSPKNPESGEYQVSLLARRVPQ